MAFVFERVGVGRCNCQRSRKSEVNGLVTAVRKTLWLVVNTILSTQSYPYLFQYNNIMLWLAAPSEKMKQILHSDRPLEQKDWPISPTRDFPL